MQDYKKKRKRKKEGSKWKLTIIYVLHYLVKKPGTEDNLRCIVDDQDFAELERLSVFHELGSEYLQ